VYTRGSARLSNGEARVRLGSTFAWVANPDVGLTAHLTPRGAWSDLYVESVGTNELVVKSAGGDPSAAFDYAVYGLRIGFEEVSIVQEKTREAFIPSMTEHRRRYAREPELRSYSALERFTAMDASIEAGARGTDQAAGRTPRDFQRSAALAHAVHEYDPRLDGPVDRLPRLHRERGYRQDPLPASEDRTVRSAQTPDRAPIREGGTAADVAAIGAGDPTGANGAGGAKGERAVRDATASPASTTSSLEIDHATLLPVIGSVEPGDVLVADAESAGSLRRGEIAADPAVIGVAGGAASGGQAPVLTSGIVLCKVDARYGSIRPGDLLTTSPTEGHAMRLGASSPGAILGKALERLDDGARAIKVLLTVR
jgi:hypothetical protein